MTRIKRLLQRATTFDLAGVEVLAKEQVGRTRFRTPEGYLYCKDVVVARLGEMLYAPGEVPVEPGPDGIIRISRDADTLFDPEALASYQGKPITDEHPPVEVTPENWKLYAKGLVLNPRRGEGDDADVMLCDFLITDKALIEAVEANKRETSNGYDADYKQIARGQGKQLHIIGNHIALVTRGRCGPRCSIGDQDIQPTEEEPSMANQKRVPLKEAIRQAFKDAGESLAETLAGDDPGGEGGESGGATHIYINGAGMGTPGAKTDDETPGADVPGGGSDPMEQRFATLEGVVNKMGEQISQIAAAVGGVKHTPTDPPVTKDELPDEKKGDEVDEKKDDKMTTDSAALSTSFQSTLADAEILVPGLRLPTFDAALPRAKTVDAMCSLRRSVLSQLQATNDGVALLAQMGEQAVDFSKLDCTEVASSFRSAALLKKAATNTRTTDRAVPIVAAASMIGGPRGPSAAEMNKANAEFWANANK